MIHIQSIADLEVLRESVELACKLAADIPRFGKTSD
jgi:hypothetical protein